MHHADVCRWLAQLPGSPSTKLPSSKRKRISVMTPPPSHDNESQSRKRQRLEVDDLDPLNADCDASVDMDATPRPASRAHARIAKSKSNSISESSSQQSSSCASGSQKSSPRKKMASLSLQVDGIASRVLHHSTPGIPRELLLLMKTFGSIRTGSGILPDTLKDALTAEATRDPSLSVTDYNFRSSTAEDAKYPAIDALLGVVDWASRSQRKGVSEATWNMNVHCPLLHLAVHGGSRPRGGLIGFEPCTTAEIIKEYLPIETPGKRVDFVLHIEPPTDMQESIDALRNGLPLISINHTGAEALLDCPITASIETKRHGAGTGDAELQIGTWHAAQWKFLHDLVGRNAGVGRDARVASKLDQLPFLPGVIIDGHDWALVATTRSGMKTLLWTEFPFGSTRDIIGVCQVVQGIQELMSWSETVCWPWFRQHVLRV